VLVILLEEEEIVCGRHGDNILLWMPGSVEDLLVEIETVHRDLVLFPLPTRTYLSRFEHCLWLGHFSGGLQRHLFTRAPVKHSEEVVIATGHDGRVRPIPTALKLVEDAVVLIEGAQFGTEVLMNSEGFDRFGFHMKIPHLYGQVVPGNHVSAGI